VKSSRVSCRTRHGNATEIDGVRCSPVERCVTPPGVIESEIPIQPLLQRSRHLVSPQVDVLILDAAP
jgi:hypothetical protein